MRRNHQDFVTYYTDLALRPASTTVTGTKTSMEKSIKTAKLEIPQVIALSEWQSFLNTIDGKKTTAKKATPGQWESLTGVKNVEYKIFQGQRYQLIENVSSSCLILFFSSLCVLFHQYLQGISKSTLRI